MTFIGEFNSTMTDILSINLWGTLEIIFGCGIIFACLLQRVYGSDFQSGVKFAFITKIAQLGLYGQIMMGMIGIVDGYENYDGRFPHAIITIWAISSTLVKVHIFYNWWFNKRSIEFA